MCRLMYMGKKIELEKLNRILLHLEKEAGGDGNGIGGFIDGEVSITKDIENTTPVFASKMIDETWDTGVLFHTRRASVGPVNNDNCHPYVYNNAITIHNGHIEASGLLKLMMIESLDKYAKDGWTIESLAESTDSNILAYFINKYGFSIVPMLSCGTVLTMYKDRVEAYVGYCLQAILIDGAWLYASSFPVDIALESRKWVAFTVGSSITIYPDSSCKIHTGGYVDGKQVWLDKQQQQKEVI